MFLVSGTCEVLRRWPFLAPFNKSRVKTPRNSPNWTIPHWTLCSAVMNGKSRGEKSIYTREYRAMLRLLREFRENAGVTQVQLAELLCQTQSYVSKIERGDRRLDVIQLRTILAKLGVPLLLFVKSLESELAGRR